MEKPEGPDKQSGRSKQSWLSKVRCYKCQGFGHLKRDCPKIEARKANRKYIGFEWEITGTIQGQGAQVTLIPERFAEVVELDEITHVRGVGSEFGAYEADI